MNYLRCIFSSIRDTLKRAATDKDKNSWAYENFPNTMIYAFIVAVHAYGYES